MTLRLAPLLVSLSALLLVTPPAEATFPGANGRIAFASGGSFSGPADSDPTGWSSAISLVGPRGGSNRELRSCLEHEGDSPAPRCHSENESPSFSPNGRLIAFDAGSRIGLMRADGSHFRLLPAKSADDGEPAFSPDGRRLVFTGRDGGATAVFVRVIATGRTRLLAAGASEPAWSVRGRIAFVRSGLIWSSRPGGGSLRRLAAGSAPDWSPGGRRLAFARAGRLWILSAGEVRRVRAAQPIATNPVWSPDGRRLASEADDGVRIARLHGRSSRLLVESQTGDSGGTHHGAPAWQPLGG